MKTICILGLGLSRYKALVTDQLKLPLVGEPKDANVVVIEHSITPDLGADISHCHKNSSSVVVIGGTEAKGADVHFSKPPNNAEFMKAILKLV